MIEYWRWWLVHLWVEGFFEVFATAVVALIFTRLGLVARVERQPRHRRGDDRVPLRRHPRHAAPSVLDRHADLGHRGGRRVLGARSRAAGAASASRRCRPTGAAHAAPWVGAYKWPILCFVAVGFWNTVGAGLLGFAINPPASLYYVQGLNMTPAHGHAALFGVYGMLGIGLMLFCLRGLYARDAACRPLARRPSGASTSAWR